MLYKVESGPVQEKGYGITLAGAVGFPRPFLEHARHVSDTLRTQSEAKKRGSSARNIAVKRKLILRLREALRVASNSGMGDGALAAYLRKLQDEFIQRMEENERPVQEGSEESSEEGSEEEDGPDDKQVTKIEEEGGLDDGEHVFSKQAVDDQKGVIVIESDSDSD